LGFPGLNPALSAFVGAVRTVAGRDGFDGRSGEVLDDLGSDLTQDIQTAYY
jgi:hypothetical protein